MTDELEFGNVIDFQDVHLQVLKPPIQANMQTPSRQHSTLSSDTHTTMSVLFAM